MVIPGPDIKLINNITVAFSKILKNKLKKSDYSNIGKKIINTIIDKNDVDEKMINSPIILTKKEEFISELFEYANEIHKSYLRLELSIKLIRRIENNKGFKRHELLNYYFENFINELYIFLERINSLLDILIKKTKILGLQIQYKNLVKTKQFFLKFFDSQRKARNYHTHIRRYKDKNYEKLELMELFNSHIKNKHITNYTNYIYLNTKKDDYNTTKKLLEDVRMVTDKCLWLADTILFKKIMPKL